MFQCCSLETSHPCLLPQSPKVCSVKLLFLNFHYFILVTTPLIKESTPWSLIWLAWGSPWPSLIPRLLFSFSSKLRPHSEVCSQQRTPSSWRQRKGALTVFLLCWPLTHLWLTFQIPYILGSFLKVYLMWCKILFMTSVKVTVTVYKMHYPCSTKVLAVTTNQHLV